MVNSEPEARQIHMHVDNSQIKDESTANESSKAGAPTVIVGNGLGDRVAPATVFRFHYSFVQLW